MPPPVTITSIEFSNFKALPQYSVKLQHMNVLVGPNNCGKSTILSALRALMAGIRRARAKSPERVSGPKGDTWGYRVPADALPLSIENVHTDYSDTDTTVLFRVSNGNRLRLYFPKERECILLTETAGRSIHNPSGFRSAFPLTIGIVPVLGPVEHEEHVLKVETVQQALATHRASRHFRNYWRHFPDGFKEFAALLKRTWPGMEILFPELGDPLTGKLGMFCLENRISRELFWAGFGFQIWCQLLTHISRSSHDAVLVIDEPEIYLHPDVQRQLLEILRNAGPDIVLATHSTEIMSEADPSEILLIDKSKRSAERLQNIAGVQIALNAVGSVQNITLTQLARNRRVLFVEGTTDFAVLRRFAHRLGLAELAAGSDLTPLESGGFASWQQIRALAQGIEKTLGCSLKIGAIFDHDFWCDEEIASIEQELRRHLNFAHVHQRKEIENYLLVPQVLGRVFKKLIDERVVRHGEAIATSEDIAHLLDEITQPEKNTWQSQYIAKRLQFLKHSKLDPASIASEAIEIFEAKWRDVHTRMQIVHGKVVLGKLRDEIQVRHGVTITDYRIVSEFRTDEIPEDLRALLNQLETFRKS